MHRTISEGSTNGVLRAGVLAVMGASIAFASLAHAADTVPEADYRFNSSYASTVGGAPDLTPIAQGDPATTGTFSTETVDGIPNVPVFLFGENRGLIASTTGVVSPDSYSVVFYSRQDVVTLGTTGIAKLIDFKNRTSDAGQYIVGGVPTFYDGLLPVVPGAGAYESNVYSQFVLTRDDAGLVSVYLDGASLYSFDDSASELATLSEGVLTFFADDPNTAGLPLGLSIEPAEGAIARLRLYDGALSAEQVAGLDTLVPEPTTLASLGSVCLLLLRRRRGV